MNKDYIIDYLGCILLKAAGPLIRKMPIGHVLFLGRRLGEIAYCFDFKHRAIAYANIKTALGGKLSPSELRALAKDFYRSFGQNVMELFFIPLIDKAYLDKYISFAGLNYINEGFKGGRGVIILAIHEGSWELSNIICANLGFPFKLFIRNQRYPRLDRLLNAYRCQKGCQVIQRGNQTRGLIRALKNNEAVGMTADQGGKGGISARFLGRNASLSAGAVRLALKYGSAIILSYYVRIKGPYIKVILSSPLRLKKTGDSKLDTQNNLQEVAAIFTEYILRYPKEYLWTYKIWKYSNHKNILILNDAKAGHLRQSQAVARVIESSLKDRGMNAHCETKEIRFKYRFGRHAITLCSCLAGGYLCQSCLWCLKRFLEEKDYQALVSIKPDIIISAGSSLAPVNLVLSRENLAKSIVIMRPSILNTKRFTLVIMPWHDRPPKRKNVVVTHGALNLINDGYLKEQAAALKPQVEISKELVWGLFIGGDSGGFSLSRDLLIEIIKQTKAALEKQDAELLVTTSRRTSEEAASLLKEEFAGYPRCRLLVIANERNPGFTVGGMLGLSQIVIVSPESISMISEAASSKRHVLVFYAAGLGVRHKRFLGHLAGDKYIHLVEPCALSKKIEEVCREKPEARSLDDAFSIGEAIKRIL